MPPLADAYIAHQIPGRLRLKVPRLRADPHLEEQILDQLAGLDDVQSVTVRTSTGSVLVYYAVEERTPTSLLASVASVLRVQEQQPTRRPAPAELSVGEMAAEWSHERWRHLDRSLKNATEGALDLGTLIPLFFVYLAVRQFLIHPHLSPIPWYTALYWAHQAFNRYYGRPTRPPRSGWTEAEEDGSGES